MAGAIMTQGKIRRVVVGADRIAANGDVANKIGTYTVAILAKEHGIPFYVAAPWSTIDLETPDGDGIPIEQRSTREVTHHRRQAAHAQRREGREPGLRRHPSQVRHRHHHRARRGARAVRGVAAAVGRDEGAGIVRRPLRSAAHKVFSFRGVDEVEVAENRITAK